MYVPWLYALRTLTISVGQIQAVFSESAHSEILQVNRRHGSWYLKIKERLTWCLHSEDQEPICQAEHILMFNTVHVLVDYIWPRISMAVSQNKTTSLLQLFWNSYTGEMSLLLRTLAALPQDTRLIPDNYMGQLTRMSQLHVISWPLLVSVCTSTHAEHIYAPRHTHIQHKIMHKYFY